MIFYDDWFLTDFTARHWDQGGKSVWSIPIGRFSTAFALFLWWECRPKDSGQYGLASDSETHKHPLDLLIDLFDLDLIDLNLNPL